MEEIRDNLSVGNPTDKNGRAEKDLIVVLMYLQDP